MALAVPLVPAGCRSPRLPLWPALRRRPPASDSRRRRCSLTLGFIAGKVSGATRSRRQAGEVEEPWEDSEEVDRQIAGLLAKNLVRVVQSQRVPVSSLHTGQRLTGIVRAIESFGAFVDVGAQRDGLVPIQLISEKYVADVYEEIMPGQKVTVWVEEVKSNGRLTLTMLPKYLRPPSVVREDLLAFRQLPEDVWLRGRVNTRKASEALVDVPVPGQNDKYFTGVLRERDLAGRVALLADGQEIQVRVLQVELRNRRLNLSARAAPTKPRQRATPSKQADQANLGLFHNVPRDAWLEADVERTTRSEAFLRVHHPGILDVTAEGQVNVSRMSDMPVEDPAEIVEIGQEIQVKILDIDLKRRRLVCSMV
ncbi:PETs [Symbiodinium sp. CCMP2592]|nr:PETs [Symbiodinium sp. CCMP2592]